MQRLIYLSAALLSGLLLLSPPNASAQEAGRKVTGTVYEQGKENKTPLAGAVIAAMNNSAGTQTAADGHFELSVPDSVRQLVISYTGFKNDTITISGSPLEIVLAQPRSLQEIVVRDRMKSTEIGMLGAMKTEKIGARELLKAACCNLSESFETTPSVDVAFTDAISGYKQIQMLGLAGPYTVITRENIPEVRGLAAVTGLTFTPGTWIEGMQLSKGTGSVVNGYETVAGQINVELHKPFEEEKAWLNLYQSTQGRTEANLVYNHKFNDKLSSNLMLHAKSQWEKVDQNNDGFLDQPLGNQFGILNRWFYMGKNGLEIQGGVKASFMDNRGGQWGYEKGMEQVPGNPWGFQQKTNRVEGWAKIGKVWTDKPWKSVGLQLSGLYHQQDAQYGTREYDGTERSFYSNLIYQSIIGNTNHVIKGGASFLLDNYDETFVSNQYTRNEVVPGVFAEYAWSHLTKWNVVAGLRADYHNMYGTFVTPRLHIRYAPFTNTSFRASAGRAQRTANIFAESIGYMASNRQFIIVNPQPDKAYGLNPEVAWNFGLNATQKFKLNYRSGAFSVDYYYTYFQNQVVTDLENMHQVRFYNLDGQSFAHSFQAQLDYEPIRKLDVRIAYRWYDVKTTYDGVLKERPLVAANRAFINIGYETKNDWKFDYTFNWVGTKRIPSVEHANDMAETQSPSYIQMNAQISKTFRNNLEIYVGGENLTNYMQHDLILGASNPYGDNFDASMVWGPAMGRNVYVGLRYKIK
ncbi:TonB-dependent receptor [Taibaiella soli]|uniref:TonB-dependent receptor n=1 Tax=Taibaiella soli TaxID=1649169 RepID=A0A2W2ALU2_9BACT|nr:TonB-dependent receptor [Taibaiella soli]PZF74502.1 TonB-dependent receptor [Taibaiella soli]